MYDMFTTEEYQEMEDIWYQSMVDSVYDTAEEINLKNYAPIAQLDRAPAF